MQLYEKIGKSIDRYVKDETRQPSKETISMRRAQLDLNVSWQKCDSPHLKMFGLESDKVYTYLMVIKVRAVSKVNEYSHNRPISSAYDNSMEKNNNHLASTNNSNGHQMVAAIPSEIPIVSSENVDRTAPDNEIDEPLNLILLKENFIEDDERTDSLELISPLPYQSRVAVPSFDRTNFGEICWHDDDYDAYNDEQDAIIQSQMRDQEFLQFSGDGKLTEKRPIEPDDAKLNVDDGEIKKKRIDIEVHVDNSKQMEAKQMPTHVDETPITLEQFMWVKAKHSHFVGN